MIKRYALINTITREIVNVIMLDKADTDWLEPDGHNTRDATDEAWDIGGTLATDGTYTPPAAQEPPAE